MENNLIKLYNTLLSIETKGENTMVMATCLKFLKQMIDDAQRTKVVPNAPNEPVETNN